MEPDRKAATPAPCVPLIFVLDDDDAVRDSMQVLLETKGYEATTFDTVAHFREGFAGARRPPDCVILDVHLPDGDGRVLSAQLAAQSPGLPIILMSGRGNGAMGADAGAAGAFAFLEKPVNIRGLFDAIGRIIAHSPRCGEEPMN